MKTENKISRRKFLSVSAGAAAALLCIGCGVKVDKTASTADTVNTVDTILTTTSTNQSVPTNSVPTNSAVSSTLSPTVTPLPVNTQVPIVTTSRCPKGLINDPYPGRCRRYIDQNGNGICDLSEVG